MGLSIRKGITPDATYAHRPHHGFLEVEAEARVYSKAVCLSKILEYTFSIVIATCRDRFNVCPYFFMIAVFARTGKQSSQHRPFSQTTGFRFSTEWVLCINHSDGHRNQATTKIFSHRPCHFSFFFVFKGLH